MIFSDKTLRNIMVLGCSGGGKSTLARRLSEVTGLRCIHMDLIYWKPNWVERDRETVMNMVIEQIKPDGWVFDGNHSSSYDLRLSNTHIVIWVDIPRWRCLLNVCFRVIQYRGRTRPDMTIGCPEKVDWAFLKFIWDFKNRGNVKIATMLERVKDRKRIYHLKNYAEIDAFVEEMRKEYGQEY